MICHTTVWILYVEPEVALSLGLLIFTSAASDITTKRALPNLLLYQFLILFVLLHILLKQLAKVCIELVITVLACLDFTLLRSRLGSVEKPIARLLLIHSNIRSVTALVHSRAFLHNSLLIQDRLRAFGSESHWCKALVLLRSSYLLRTKVLLRLSDIAQVQATANFTRILVLIVL